MAKETYEKALANVLRHEGGYTNHPRDPGGPTNFGITIYDYHLYIDKNGTAQDVKNMSVDQAKAIYKSKYWDILRCDDLPIGVDYSVFDLGVNSGIGRAGQFLRSALSLPPFALKQFIVTDDVVVAALKSDPIELIKKINDMRMTFLKRLGTWSTFGRGWTRRVSEVTAISIELATAGV